MIFVVNEKRSRSITVIDQINQVILTILDYIYNLSMVCQEFSLENIFFVIIEESVYISSNMDDLIDSMARRHLAHRRLDVCMTIFRLVPSKSLDFRERLIDNDEVMDFMLHRLVKFNHCADFQSNLCLLEPLNTGRTSSRTNPSGFNQRLRSRIDYYNRIQPDLDNVRLKTFQF